jgi:ribosomal protein S18 acetylase RimI-like enzyme
VKVGYFAYLISKEEPQKADLYEFVVIREFEGQGYGTECTKRMLRSLWWRGVTDVYCHNHEDAGALWKRFGFQEILFRGTPDFIRNDERSLEDRIDYCLWDDGRIINFREMNEEEFYNIDDHATYLHLEF